MQKNQKENEKRKLRLVEKYDNDDFSRFAGPDYTENNFEIGQPDFTQSAHQNKEQFDLGEGRTWHHPGVSGKTDDEAWVNQNEYRKQANFVGYGPKNYKRSDDRIFEEVCEALMRHPRVDASHIGVKVDEGIVSLSGKVRSREEKKLAERTIEDLPGVQDVRNELSIFRGDPDKAGPESATKKDLGIN
jgi:hypothetical protein